ncbi:MAG: hypothetical protein RL456_2360 [Pseudomonadota bacterium]|jgi:uncharacterized membrane protein (UPF0127 family)
MRNMIHIKFDLRRPALSAPARCTRRPACGQSATAAGLRRALVVLATVAASAVGAQTGPQKLATVQLTAGMHLIRAEVARTDSERQIGLMHRPSMPAGDGMLFIFEQPGVQCFWMRNTLIPLSAAFVDDGGRIVNIEDMQPQSDDSHCSKKPVRFVLEMNQGWFARKGLGPGSRIGGGPFAAARP